MAEPTFTAEHRGVLAYLYQHGEATPEEIAEHFESYNPADNIPLDLMSAYEVRRTLAGLSGNALVRQLWTKRNCWALTEKTRTLMKLGADLGFGGLREVLHA